MLTTSILHIASSLLLLPYGFLCVYGIKAKLDPDASETELVEEEQDSDRTLRSFLLGIDGVVSELVGGHSLPWYYFEAPGLIAGAIGAFGSWVPNGYFFYICNYLLVMSAFYFFIMIPYILNSLKQRQYRQSAPLVAGVVGINALATGIRVGILEAPYDTKAFADPFHCYLGCLFAYCVFANVVLSCKKQCSNKRETDIEEFDDVDKYSMVDSKAGDVLGGYREPLLPIQIV